MEPRHLKEILKDITSLFPYSGTVKIPLSCDLCDTTFTRDKKRLMDNIHYEGVKELFCSPRCMNIKNGKLILGECAQCKKPTERVKAEVIKSKSDNMFCNRSCSAAFNNKGKQRNPKKIKCCVRCKAEWLPSDHRATNRKLCTKCREEEANKKYYITKDCAWCSKPVRRRIRLISKSKHPEIFCNRLCAAPYALENWMPQRSQLEVFLEEQIKKNYPNLEVKCNNSKRVGLELDIYLPEIELAFEINGPFHYLPIFGEEQLSKVQERDKRKLDRCAEENIVLFVFDVRKVTKVNDALREYYWSLVNNKIDLYINCN